MRFLHTADWHLGRLFHGSHLVEDQAHVLDQLVTLVAESRLDAVVIAGDVYDRAVPPPDAVALLDDVLSRLILDCGVPVLLIAGNHDSPDRLGFGARLLQERGLHVAGRSSLPVRSVELGDAHGPVRFHLLPYTEPAIARELTGDEDLRSHDAALGALLEGLRAPGTREVIAAHAFVAGGGESESERPLSVGGSGMVSPDRFRPFNYAALGHLHRPQTAGADHVRYSGSLLKYSFSEASHEKSVSIVELDPEGAATVERVSLSPRRDLRILDGTLHELLEAPRGPVDDYLMVRLRDKGAVLDALGKLRTVYPNVMAVERPELSGRLTERSAKEMEGLTPLELFGDFFRECTGEPMDETQRAAFVRVTESLERRLREVEP